MVQEELSQEDKQRVRSCDYYTKAKDILKAIERDKALNVGEVYFIKYWDDYEKKHHYQSYSYGGNPSKYMVFHKDEKGFAFVKRINANGKLGKIVECVTTQYTGYEMEPDPEYVESIILNTEDSYDPLAAEKEMVRKKSRARSKNKKLEIKYDTAQEAYDYIKTLNAGDMLWETNTAFGQGIRGYKITSIEKRKVDQAKVADKWGGHREDRLHDENSFAELIEISMVNKTYKAKGYMDTKATFYNFWKDGYKTYYKSKPYSVEDV